MKRGLPHFLVTPASNLMCSVWSFLDFLLINVKHSIESTASACHNVWLWKCSDTLVHSQKIKIFLNVYSNCNFFKGMGTEESIFLKGSATQLHKKIGQMSVPWILPLSISQKYFGFNLFICLWWIWQAVARLLEEKPTENVQTIYHS